MDRGLLQSDHLLDILNAPQLYSFEVWVDTINLDKNKIQLLTPVENLDDNASGKTERNKVRSSLNKSPSDRSNGDNAQNTRHFRIGYDDYTLPNGLKPFRVRFNLFGIKAVSITQIEYDKMLKLGIGGEILSVGSQDSNVSVKSKRRLSNRKIKSDSAKLKQDAANKGLKEVTISESQPRKSETKPYVFNLDEIIDLIDAQIFIPRNEAVMKKGASATFAMAPIKLMQSLQSGEIAITVDRYGGRKTDEGDPQGKCKLTIPKEWKETVLKVANEPKLAPEILEISDNISIIHQSGEEIGTMEYTLCLTCHAGCVVSTAMPSQLGLYVALGEAVNANSFCHTPIVNKKIDYQSMMRKSMNQDYTILYKPACTKSIRPTKY